MSRRVDREKNQRTKPMQVIGLGLCRTGTMGLYWALNALGYRTYHMMETLKNGERDMNLLYEAFKGKFEGETPFGREEFDKWYGQYDAVCDVQSAFFVEELYAAYPDAKFILTDRNPDAWVRSMHKTIFASAFSKPMQILAWLDGTAVRPLWEMSHKMAKNLCGYPDDERTKHFYIKHVERVKAIIPAEKLLYLKLEEGITWEKLCPFLEKPIPDTPIPRGEDNGPGHFQSVAQDFMNRAILGLATRFLAYSAVPVIAVGLLYLRRQPGGLRLSWL